MSASGACIRLKDAIGVGSRLTIKWHREQFSATARNCRADGTDYLLGLRRDSSGLDTPLANTVPERNATIKPSPTGSTPPPSSIAASERLQPSKPSAVRATAASRRRFEVPIAEKRPETPEKKLRQNADSESRNGQRSCSSRKESYATQTVLSPFLAPPA